MFFLFLKSSENIFCINWLLIFLKNRLQNIYEDQKLEYEQRGIEQEEKCQEMLSKIESLNKLLLESKRKLALSESNCIQLEKR